MGAHSGKDLFLLEVAQFGEEPLEGELDLCRGRGVSMPDAVSGRLEGAADGPSPWRCRGPEERAWARARAAAA